MKPVSRIYVNSIQIAEAYLELSWASVMARFCENS